jgi:hypothetical protein
MGNDDAPQQLPGVAPSIDSVPGVAAISNLTAGNYALDFANAQDRYNAPQRDAVRTAATSIGNQQIGLADAQYRQYGEDANTVRSTVRPLQQRIMTQAINYDTPGRREQMAGEAIANTGSQIQASQNQMMRQQASMGVDPSSGASLALARRSAVLGGAAQAAAGNSARLSVEDGGFARGVAASGIGQQISGDMRANGQSSMAAGNQGIQSLAAPLGLESARARDMYAGISTGISGNTAAGGLMRAAGAGNTTQDNSGIDWGKIGELGAKVYGSYSGSSK